VANDELSVSYPVKELLEDLKDSVKQGFAEQTLITNKLFTLNSQLTDRVAILENDKANKTASRGFLKEAILMICTIVLAVSGAVGIITALHG